VSLSVCSDPLSLWCQGGTIDVSGKGGRGGSCGNLVWGRSESGECQGGYGGGGQAGTYCSIVGCTGGGGGGGYGTAGADAVTNSYLVEGGPYLRSKGGAVCGDASLLCQGAGGGGGYGDCGSLGGAGGRGGGLIVIRCWELSNLGRMLADGTQGGDALAGPGSGGGGGSGGSIRIEAERLGEGGTGRVSAWGGRGGNAGAWRHLNVNTRGGSGGDGRIVTSLG
jgi:hypothetical protein